MPNFLSFGNNFVMGLKEYQNKRNFKATSEPKGKINKKEKNKIFVIQYHHARREHFDLRLEWKGVLLSWAVPKVPSYDPKDKRLAVRVEDHPVDYASFEGVIPKGQYGGGTVLVWDKGFYEPEQSFEKGLKEGVLKFKLFGQRMQGSWALIELKDKKNWLLIKESDEYENFCELSQYKTSIITKRDSDQLLNEEDLSQKENPFQWVEPKFASLAEKIPHGDEWLFEVKYDGYRILSFAQQGKVRLWSRNKKEYTSKFKEVAKSIEALSKSRAFVLDGEMVILDDEGRSNFQDMQNFVKTKQNKPLVYMVFDLLALDGKDLRDVDLIERKELLKELLSDAVDNIVFSEHVRNHGEECFIAAQNMGLEGIVGKLATSKYSSGRGEDWIKIKCRKRQEFVVGGFVSSEKKKVSSLLVGVYENKKLIFYGKVGTGFKLKEEKSMLEEFEELKTEKSPFSSLPKFSKSEKISFLKPKLVAEIEFAEITGEGLLRQASFKGFRHDKSAKEVCFEKEIEIEDQMSEKKMEDAENDKMIMARVEISNPQKIIYKESNVKKEDVVKYYFDVSKKMLPFLKNRVLSVVRCHGQLSEKNTFFKKHPNTQSEGVKIISIENSEGEKLDYFYVENVTGILSEVQLGTLEFHTWGSTVKNLDKPDVMVFDLDPDEGLSLKQLRQGVKDLKKILESLNLKSFLKTSGGKGYHVVVPFKPSVDWEKFHDFAESVANVMEQKWPDRYTSNMRKDSRKDKIFIDWVRNGKGATSIAPYSLRARNSPTVSMPIFWSELDKIAPNDITIFNARQRLSKKDPWANFFKIKQELK